MSRHVRKGDMVAVVAGDDRGKRGRVLRVFPDDHRVIVEGVNLVFKHLRRSQKNPQGGRIRREAPIHASNVLPIDPESNLPTRIRSRVDETGRRVRVSARSGAAIEGAPGRRATVKKGPGDEADAAAPAAGEE